jgi:opacity protein-like surface antigen
MWAAGVLATLVTLAPPSEASALDPIVAGTKDVGLGGTISISHGTSDGFDTVTGLQLLPHVGFIVTDSAGPSLLRGNLEALVEPTLMHLGSDAGSATVLGVSTLARWIFSGTPRLRPYVEGGVGVLVGEPHLQQTDCETNFLLQAGTGVMVVLSDTTTLSVGYRFQHISNGGTCSFNVGINSSALYLGVNYFFR